MKTKELYLYKNNFNFEYKLISRFFFEYESVNINTIINYFKKNNYDELCVDLLTKYKKINEITKYKDFIKITNNLNFSRFLF